MAKFMVQKINKKKIAAPEAVAFAIENFVSWYTAGVMDARKDLKPFQNKMERIKRKLKFFEFNELVFKSVLQREGFDIKFSNIHTKIGDAAALGVDLFAVKDNDCAFFVEVKGSGTSDLSLVKQRFKSANTDIENRLSKLGESIDDMESEFINSSNLSKFKISGIACVGALVNFDNPGIPTHNQYLGFYVEIDLHESVKYWGQQWKKIE